MDEDLKALGALEWNSVREVTVPVLDHHEWLGAAYVLKGAQLGSFIIATHLYRHLGIRENGATFFQNDIVDAGQLQSDWNQWREELDRIYLSDFDSSSVVVGAQKVFRYFSVHLDEATELVEL